LFDVFDNVIADSSPQASASDWKAMKTIVAKSLIHPTVLILAMVQATSCYAEKYSDGNHFHDSLFYFPNEGLVKVKLGEVFDVPVYWKGFEEVDVWEAGAFIEYKSDLFELVEVIPNERFVNQSTEIFSGERSSSLGRLYVGVTYNVLHEFGTEHFFTVRLRAKELGLDMFNTGGDAYGTISATGEYFDGAVGGPGLQIAVVPEPSTAMLLIGGALVSYNAIRRVQRSP
jgi:hypothetical protein